MAKTPKIPARPFLTERFAPEGGGIDFLGLAPVNMRLLEEHLIPGINNQTRDLGTYCLATWIAWKFRRLAPQPDFTLSAYRRFREGVEVALSYTLRSGSPSNELFGPPRNLVGLQQKLALPGALTFANARRKPTNTLFSAPLYGPSLRYLGLIAGDALARDGTSTGIPLASEDEDTERIVHEVEEALSACPDAARVCRLAPAEGEAAALDRLGLQGLNPAHYRGARPDAKRAFLRKFLVPARAGDMADRRRLTARLIVASVGQHAFPGLDSLRSAWYTGLRPGGGRLDLADAELRRHREGWAVFQARQIQRTFLETFLRCFELALREGCRSIEEVIEYWWACSPDSLKAARERRFGQFVRAEVALVSEAADWDPLSAAWNRGVHGEHPLFDDVPGPEEDDVRGELARALQMLARWWIRLRGWLRDGLRPDLMGLGGRDRVSITWFAGWVAGRLERPLSELVRDLFAELIFAQHLRVALSRFDGRLQRLHFLLGDRGLAPTPEAEAKLGRPAVRMADRLGAFVGLLCDLDILEDTSDRPLALGPNARLVIPATAGPGEAAAPAGEVEA